MSKYERKMTTERMVHNGGGCFVVGVVVVAFGKLDRFFSLSMVECVEQPWTMMMNMMMQSYCNKAGQSKLNLAK
jgi:hypothetical protein